LDPIPSISATELSERLRNGHPIRLLDVREPFERRIADLPDTDQQRIPMGELERRVGELDRDVPVVVYCRTGSRSGLVTRWLRARGFDQAWNLEGGVMAWRDEIDPSLEAY
jgi:adenylyltransferase/sulfurtransferase